MDFCQCCRHLLCVGQYIAILIVGKLVENKPGKPHLLLADILKKQSPKVLFIVLIDTAAYLLAAKNLLKRLLIII
jgi:hypothetical protein